MRSQGDHSGVVTVPLVRVAVGQSAHAVIDPAFTAVCALTDIPVLGARVVVRPAHPDGNIAVFRTGEDRVFATLDRCPHRGGPLSQGIVYGDRVACPLHNWSVELATGCAVAPDEGCTKTFATCIERGVVYVAAG